MPRLINVDTVTVASPSLHDPPSDAPCPLDAEIMKRSPGMMLSLANLAALRQRIRIEEEALREATDFA
jgi:hypothetical protein